jgi:uncharacterized membrane protein
MDQFFGVPAHPLLVHLPVVFVPLALLGAIAIAVVPRWRATFGWAVVATSFVGLLGAVLAANSGESLQARVDESAALDEHIQLGESARLAAFVFFVVVAGLVVLAFVRARAEAGNPPSRLAVADVLAPIATKGIITAFAVLSVLAGVGASVQVARAGHQGAKVTWEKLGPPRPGERD